jgi:hypothetical protein
MDVPPLAYNGIDIGLKQKLSVLLWAWKELLETDLFISS